MLKRYFLILLGFTLCHFALTSVEVRAEATQEAVAREANTQRVELASTMEALSAMTDAQWNEGVAQLGAEVAATRAEAVAAIERLMQKGSTNIFLSFGASLVSQKAAASLENAAASVVMNVSPTAEDGSGGLNNSAFQILAGLFAMLLSEGPVQAE